jgi:acyl-CoA thioester hydrolase
MSRVKINFPNQFPIFNISMPVRITDLNYGNHLGNDSVLSIVHEARAQYLHINGYTELNVGGCGLIMADAAVVYKNEAFFGDILSVNIYCDDITAVSFDLLYKLTTIRNEKEIVVALVKTGMVCFDYDIRKVCALPAHLNQILQRQLVE